MSVLSEETIIVGYYDDAAEASRREAWQARLQPYLPQVKLVPLHSEEAQDAIAVTVWKPPHGVLASLPHLKGIISLGQGVDHVLADPSLPQTVPLVRLVDPDMSVALGHWVSLAVLSHIRKAADYRALRARREFRPLPQQEAQSVKIGLYGVGAIGAEVARQLQALHFDVTGYVSAPRSDKAMRYCHGPDGFDHMLREMDIHICVMPLTDETRGCFNQSSFAKMKVGAYLINAGRGAHVVEDDLQQAISTGHLAGACLDVFVDEPLPPSHPFWANPHIEIWPHVAAQTNPNTAAQQVAKAIHAFATGQPAQNIVDRQKGY